MLAFLWSLGAFIVALGILVAVHEWGHFYVARKCGVQVERFSIGFGKPIWRKTSKSGTEYVIAMIPLGGYVRMLDGRIDDVPPELEDKAFNNKPVLQRMAVIAAGPGVNFIFAFFENCVFRQYNSDLKKLSFVSFLTRKIFNPEF